MTQTIIVTRKDLMQPSGVGYGRSLTMAFLKRYDLDLGGRDKPRRYDLALVDDFLHRYFRERLQQEQAGKKKVEDIRRGIDNIINLRSAEEMFGREMVGKGGRGVGQILGKGGRAVA